MSDNRILNPATGRWVNRDGAIGKKILAEKAKAKSKPPPKPVIKKVHALIYVLANYVNKTVDLETQMHTDFKTALDTMADWIQDEFSLAKIRKRKEDESSVAYMHFLSQTLRKHGNGNYVIDLKEETTTFYIENKKKTYSLAWNIDTIAIEC